MTDEKLPHPQAVKDWVDKQLNENVNGTTWKDIHCVRQFNGSLDEMELKKAKKLIGFYMPIDKDGNPPSGEGKIWWDVVTDINGSGFTCKTQEHAEMIAGLEEIKNMLLLLAEDRGLIKRK